MGNKSLKNVNVTDYDPSEWKVIGYHRETSEIVENIINKEKAELKILFLDPKLQIENEIQIYQYRKDQSNALVKCLSISIEEQKNKSLCGTGTVIKVLTERIPFRLYELPQLTFAEVLYALSESLRGFQECFKRLGAFEITDDMIGINLEGEIKVWVNSDFAENHPLTEKPILHTSGTVKEKEMRVEDFIVKEDEVDLVRKIVNIIEKKSESGRFPELFSNEIRKKLDFDQVFVLIEKYANKNQIFIPDRIINTETNYIKNPNHFTPGVQYQRDENDPLFRRKVQFPPELRSQNYSPNENNGNIQQYQEQISVKPKAVKRVQSPIIQLYQSENQIEQEQGTQSKYEDLKTVKPLYKFQNMNGISQIQPETSTLVFNNESCVRPHQLGKYKI